MPKPLVNQDLNGLLSFLNYLDNTVFWISSYDYSQQLFVNRSYENIWGSSIEKLQSYPESWTNSLHPEDRQIILPEIFQRSATRENSLVFFRVMRPDGQIRFIKSAGYIFYDKDGNPMAIAGMDEVLTPEQWENRHKRNKIILEPNPLIEHSVKLLQEELQLTLNGEQARSPASSAYFIKTVDDRTVKITRREAECLKLLSEGMTAKATAKKLALSHRTVTEYLDNLKRKLDCSSKYAILGKLKQIDIC